MNFLSKALLCILMSSPLIYAESENNDQINFENDDTLHGKFVGFTSSGKIIWKNESAEKNIAFALKEVRKVVFNNGKRTKPFTHNSYVTLKNLDSIPGKVISLIESQLTIETDYGGNITIPKDQIFDININPLGDKIIYRGPFSEEEPWQILFPNKPEIMTLTEKKKEEDEKDEEDKNPWKFKNFSLNHQGESSTILMKTDFPEKYRLTFNSYSSNYPYPMLTIMADLKVPEYDEDDEELKKNRIRHTSSTANYLGSSLVIKLRPTSSSLIHNGFNKDGKIFRTNITNMVKESSNRGNNLKTFYDLRVDKKEGLIMLFVDKRMMGKWQIDSLDERLKGYYFGFNMRSNISTTSVFSDIVVSSWNGVQDSALSLENETRDIVMLNNGTDRYSGNVTSIADSKVELKSPYAELAIPQEQINSITFSRKKTETPDTREKDDVTVRFYGTGRITGLLTKADDGSMFLESKILGKIKIKSEFITSFEFIDMDHAYETF